MPRYPLVPRPSHRAHPFVAAVWLALVLIPVLAGCRRVTDLTHVPTPLQPTSPTTPTTPTDAATSTPTPRPTWTPRPTVDAAVPLPVAMTLEEARAEVWSWLDSVHAPRIVSVDYVAGAAVETDRFMTRQPLVFDSQVDMDFAELLAGRRLPTTVVRVVAEFAPLDAPLYRQIDDLRGVGEPRSVVPARRVAMFDAATGARLALMSAETRQVDPRPHASGSRRPLGSSRSAACSRCGAARRCPRCAPSARASATLKPTRGGGTRTRPSQR